MFERRKCLCGKRNEEKGKRRQTEAETELNVFGHQSSLICRADTWLGRGRERREGRRQAEIEKERVKCT